MRAKPWELPDGLWERIEPLLPRAPRRFRYPGRKPLDDRRVLQGILFVLHTGIGWEYLPQELGFGCGMTAWRRLRAWQQAGVWERLHALLLAELHAADQLEWERAIADSSHLQAKKGAGSVRNSVYAVSFVRSVGLGSGRGRRRGIRTSRPSGVSSCSRGF